MVVLLAVEPGPRLCLVLCEDGEDTEDDGHPALELDSHETVRDRVADVLKVHRLALDEHTDGDDGVEWDLERAFRVSNGLCPFGKQVRSGYSV